MTKPVMGAAVQILIEEGRLSLDDTAARYLPSFDNDKSRGITVRLENRRPPAYEIYRRSAPTQQQRCRLS
jgi:hypothetical protein